LNRLQEQVRGAEPADGLSGGPVQHPSAANQSGIFVDGWSWRDGGGAETAVRWEPYLLCIFI